MTLNRRKLLHKIEIIPLVILVSTLLSCGETIETIEIDRASFSGRVVDETGNPVAGLALVIVPCEVDDEADIAVYDAETNDTGHFSITGIYPGKADFMLVPEYQDGLPLEPEYQLLSFRIGVSDYHPKDLSLDPCTQDTFFIATGAQIENVEVIVRLRMRIRAKVVLEDGTPLINEKVSLNIRALDSQGSSVVGGIQGSVQTDAQGYFVQYVDRSEAIGYRVSVEYKWLCATSEIFILGVGERRESLILKLS